MAVSLVPIAIVGMSCRFSGGANNPEQLWRLLSKGQDGWSDVPEDRFNWRAFHHPSQEMQNAHNHRGGHFLDQDIAAFDAPFFNISPLEAEAMDPQQRIQLETAFEALENAGIPIESVKGSDTAVYVSIYNRDYDAMLFKDPSHLPRYHVTGNGQAIVSNRISYVFDLRGPSMTIDTGCSGSMVAVHQACQSLRTGETSMALAGGVNVILNPDVMTTMSMMHMLNDDGKCYTFDSRGDGFGRGEGAGMVVLKRLDDALQAGDNVRAVIRNTGVNQDGKTEGITLPSQESQQNLMREVYARVGLDPQDTGYIEAHGTGTIVGDTAEMQAIAAVFCDGGTRSSSVPVGSVKMNVGHTESAAGIAGLIKATIMLEKAFVPPNPAVKAIKSSLALEKWKIRLLSSLETWPNGLLRRISVNSFGYGGSNAHAIVDAAETEIVSSSVSDSGYSTDETSVNGGMNKLTTATEERSAIPQLLVISARSEDSLLQTLENLHLWAAMTKSETRLEDLAYTLAERRSHMRWRCSIVAASLDDLQSNLTQNKSQLAKAPVSSRIVFLFTGQGSQWYAMGRELIATKREFEKSLLISEEILQRFGASWSLISELLESEGGSHVNQSDIGQPTCTAIQIALVDLLKSFNITPHAVLGHSSGEVAAAYAAGALSQEMALLVSYHRGNLTSKTTGAMLAVSLGEAELLQYISQLKVRTVCVACVNSPSSTTASGDKDAILELKEILDTLSIFNRLLKVDTAYHSHHMQLVAADYLCSLKSLDARTPDESIAFFSSVTTKQKTCGFGSDYWVQNLVSKVRYCDALQNMCRAQQAFQSSATSTMQSFVEIGPHSTLSGPSQQSIAPIYPDPSVYQYLPSLRRGQNASQTVLETVGRLFRSHHPVNLKEVNANHGAPFGNKVVTDLNPYPWNHSTQYWHESRLSSEHRFREYPAHDLLGLRITSSSPLEPTWRHLVSLAHLPWLNDHIIDNVIMFPGAGYMCMAIEAMRQLHQDNGTLDTISKYVLRGVSFRKSLVVPDLPGFVEVQISLRTSGSATSEWKEFRISSLSPERKWREHCRGSITVKVATANDNIRQASEDTLVAEAQLTRLKKSKENCIHSMDEQTLYQDLRSQGNYYGSRFATMKNLKFGDGQALASMNVPNIVSTMPSEYMQPHVIHPATLDVIMQISVQLYLQSSTTFSLVAFRIGELSVSASIQNDPGKEFLLTSAIHSAWDRHASTEIAAFQTNADSSQDLVVHITNGEIRDIGTEIKSSRTFTHQLKWDNDVDFMLSSSAEIEGRKDASTVAAQQKYRLLDQAASIFVDTCLQKIADQDLEVPKDYRFDFFKWMQRYSRSEYSRDLTSQLARPTMETRCQEAMEAGVMGEMLCRIGENLASVVTGEKDPLSVMLNGDLLHRLYADDVFSSCYAHMVFYAKRLAFKRPHLKILEVGAGTGAATLPLLQAIRDNDGFSVDQYDFTDISPAFFDRAAPQFKEWQRILRYRALDIEKDPIIQGFVEEHYDLIIACNVFHATTSIDKTLTNTRRLLNPGGTLILIEYTHAFPYLNVMMGSLPGWWSGIDDGRRDSPLLTIDQWNSALHKKSFSGVAYVESTQNLTMMVSKAVPHTKDVQSFLNTTPLILVCLPEVTDASMEFAKAMLSAFTEMQIECSIRSWSSNSYSDKAIYIILSLGKKSFTDPTSSVFDEFKTVTTEATNILWLELHHDVPGREIVDEGVVTGLARNARIENDSLNFVLLDIEQNVRDNQLIVTTITDLVLKSFYASEKERCREVEYKYRGGQLLIPRLIPDAKIGRRVKEANNITEAEVGLFHQGLQNLKLSTRSRGSVDNIRFENDESPQQPLESNEVEILCEARGLNAKDVSTALGQSRNSDPALGECAGIVTSVGSDYQEQVQVGDRVCGWGPIPYASRVRVTGDSIIALSSSMSFVEGASLPFALLTALYSLKKVGDLQKDQKILIHSAATDVGQAVLQIAQYIGAKIFATVRDVSEKNLLVEGYMLSEDDIFSTESTDFRLGICRMTNGQGVDMIINNLTGDSIQESWACISRFGTFVDVGDSAGNLVTEKSAQKHVTYAAVDVGLLSKYQPRRIGNLMAELRPMLASGALKPIRGLTIMPISNIEGAFKLVKAGTSSTKVVLEANRTSRVKILPPRASELKLDAGGTYVISGGLGGIGMDICRFIANRGAKYVAILSRRTLESAQLLALEDEFRPFDVTIRVVSCDITNPLEKLKVVIAEHFVDMPPVKGVIQAAVVLRASLLRDMSLETLQYALGPKLHGTRTLSNIFHSDYLDFFIMLSSTVGILGGTGQANYAAGNTFQDTFTMKHTSTKPHYMTLNLGPVERVGIVAKVPRLMQAMIAEGYLPIKPTELHALLDYAMSPQAREDACKQVIIGFDRRSLAESTAARTLENPMYSHLPHHAAAQAEIEQTDPTTTTTTIPPALSFEEAIARVPNEEAARDIVVQDTTRKLASLTMMSKDEIDVQTPLNELALGLDSLVTIELKNWILRMFEARVSLSDIGDSSVVGLAEVVVRASAFVRERFREK